MQALRILANPCESPQTIVNSHETLQILMNPRKPLSILTNSWESLQIPAHLMHPRKSL